MKTLLGLLEFAPWHCWKRGHTWVDCIRTGQHFDQRDSVGTVGDSTCGDETCTEEHP